MAMVFTLVQLMFQIPSADVALSFDGKILKAEVMPECMPATTTSRSLMRVKSCRLEVGCAIFLF